MKKSPFAHARHGQKFNDLAEKVGADKIVSGEDSFFVHDHGLPVDSLSLVVEEKGPDVDMVI
jgi:alanyl-tRNA synthetase